MPAWARTQLGQLVVVGGWLGGVPILGTGQGMGEVWGQKEGYGVGAKGLSDSERRVGGKPGLCLPWRRQLIVFLESSRKIMGCPQCFWCTETTP